MIAFYVTLSIIILSFSTFSAFGYLVFMRLCARNKEKYVSFETMFSEKRITRAGKERLLSYYEWFEKNASAQIQILSNDGLRLCATLIKAPSDVSVKGAVLLFHGYHSSARRDFCIQMKLLHEAGYHLIVPDQRSHGKSEGLYVCFGVNERNDAILWSKKAADIFEKDIPICLMGLSMGGATVLMASELADANPAIRCIIADCPFSSPYKIISEAIWSQHRIPRFPLLYFVDMWCRVLAKFSMFGISAAKAVRRSKLPILIIHGDGDDYVRPSHSHNIVKGANNTRLVLIKDAGHADAIYYDEALYSREVLSFLNENMK